MWPSRGRPQQEAWPSSPMVRLSVLRRCATTAAAMNQCNWLTITQTPLPRACPCTHLVEYLLVKLCVLQGFADVC
jgi:hypothetical protein